MDGFKRHCINDLEEGFTADDRGDFDGVTAHFYSEM